MAKPTECPGIVGQSVMLAFTPVAPCTCPAFTVFLNWFMPDSGDPNAWNSADSGWSMEWDPATNSYTLHDAESGDDWPVASFACDPSFRATAYNVVTNEGACTYDVTITGAGSAPSATGDQ